MYMYSVQLILNRNLCQIKEKGTIFLSLFFHRITQSDEMTHERISPGSN